MAFKLTKQETAEQANLVEELREAFSKAQDEIRSYNELVEKARNYTETVAARMREEFDGKSETWQEGDRGQEAEGLINEWEGVDLREVDEPEGDHADTLEGLPAGTE